MVFININTTFSFFSPRCNTGYYFLFQFSKVHEQLTTCFEFVEYKVKSNIFHEAIKFFDRNTVFLVTTKYQKVLMK